MRVYYGARRSSMLRPEEKDTPDECRARRRRRIQMRRLNSGTAPAPIPPTTPPNNSENHTQVFEGNHQVVAPGGVLTNMASGHVVAPVVPPPPAVPIPVTETTPEYWNTSVAGRSRDMEDAISVHTHLCRPELNGGRPVHFFGVFDGHGGAHVSALCRERMHVLMVEELMSLPHPGEGEDAAAEGWRAAIRRCFERMDELAMNSCGCGNTDRDCTCRLIDTSLVGSTAVVALLTQEHIIVANCGDSRAVLCRPGRAIPLSSDHKPDREDELARITACGGQVYYSDVPRVQGILAMSRAIGDKYLKPSVISEPEITITRRAAEDQCMIVASDGLWDVVKNELACQIAHQCIAGIHGDVNPDSPYFHSRSACAASLLTRLALGRRSSDNISVVVVDLIN